MVSQVLEYAVGQHQVCVESSKLLADDWVGQKSYAFVDELVLHLCPGILKAGADLDFADRRDAFGELKVAKLRLDVETHVDRVVCELTEGKRLALALYLDRAVARTQSIDDRLDVFEERHSHPYPQQIGNGHTA